jgi:anti-sigma B factor antagonist
MNRRFLHGRIPIWINVSGWKDEMRSDSSPPGSPSVSEYLRRLAMNMTATTRQRGSVTIVDISGRIVLGEESAALRDLVCNLLDKGHRQILFNLADVNYIDSAGLGSLVSAFTSVRKQNGELKLLNLTNKVHDVLQITKLYTVFDIMNDEAEGLSSFGKSTVATA